MGGMLADETPLASEGLRLANEDPKIPRTQRAPMRYFALYVVVAAIVTLALAIGVAWQDAIGLVIILGLFGLVLFLGARMVSNTLSAYPNWITIFPDRIEGTFDGSKGAPAKTLSIPFKAIDGIAPAHGSKDGWVAAFVSANYARVAKFQTDSVRGMMRGPPTPPGCATIFTLAEQNVEPLKRAYLRAEPTASVDHLGRVQVPEK